MRIEDLKAFVVLADVGSFRTAAEMLNVTQPALTRRIQKIEHILETQLLIRTTRSLRLTSSGIQFLDKIRPVVLEAETAMLEVRKDGTRRRGLVRIATLPSLGQTLLPDIIRDFAGTSPNVSFRLLDANALSITAMVLDGKVDFGLGLDIGETSELQVTPLFEEPIGVIAHRGHPAVLRGVTGWADLVDYPFSYNLSESGNRIIINQMLEKAGIRLDWTHQISSLAGAVALARSGLALSAIPASAAPEDDNADTVFLPMNSPEIIRRIVLLEPKDNARSPLTERFISLVLAYEAPRPDTVSQSRPDAAGGDRPPGGDRRTD